MRSTDIIIIAAVLVPLLIYAVIKYVRTKIVEKKTGELKRNQRKALEILKEHGFRLIDANKELKFTLIVDGKTYTDVYKADFIASKGFLRYPVKIITGKQAVEHHSRQARKLLAGKMHALYKTNRLIFIDVEKRNLKIIKSKSSGSVKKLCFKMIAAVGIFVLGMILSFIIWWFLL